MVEMPYTVEQIQKHTIVSRLAVSIYKMDNEQLDKLVSILEPGPDGKRHPIILPQISAEKNRLQKRSLIIARIFVLIHQLDKTALLQRLRQFDNSDFQWVREFPRLSCFLSVDFASEGKAYRSCIRDISAGGVFIETSHLFEIGQEIALCFTLSEANETLPFKIRGAVTRIYPDGIGVKYQNMTRYQREIINALLKNSG
jgi:Tfp pilus assembly protein PilZ